MIAFKEVPAIVGADNSPTPVLDALESFVGTIYDIGWGGAYSAMVDRIAKVDIVSAKDRFPFCSNISDEAFPQPGSKFRSGQMWIELRTPIATNNDAADDNNPGICTGILIDEIDPGCGQKDDSWPFNWRRATFVMRGRDSPLILPHRVLMMTESYNTSLTELRADPMLSDLPDFERMRFGLQTASAASPEQILQMANNVVELDGKFFRSIPTNDHRAYFVKPYRRYTAAADIGVEGLRRGLMSTCVERWYPAPGTSSQAGFENCYNVVTLGPIIALNVLNWLEQPRVWDWVKSDMPEPFSRGRNAVILSKAPRANAAPIR